MADPSLPTVRGGSAGAGSASSRPVLALVPGLRPARAVAGRGHRWRHHHAPQHLSALRPGQGDRRGGEEEGPPLLEPHWPRLQAWNPAPRLLHDFSGERLFLYLKYEKEHLGLGL